MIGSPVFKNVTMLQYEGARFDFEGNFQINNLELSFSIEVISRTTDEVLSYSGQARVGSKY